MGKQHNTKSDSETKNSSFLSDIRDVAFIIAVYLYFIGWVYITYYLKGFGVSIRQVDLDFYNLITYSIEVFIFVFYAHYLITLCIIILTSALVFALMRNVNFINSKIYGFLADNKRYILIPLFFVLSFTISLTAALHNSNDAKIITTSGLRTIKFVLKKEKADTVVGDSKIVTSLAMTEKNMQAVKKNASQQEKKRNEAMSKKKIPEPMELFKKWNDDGELRFLMYNKEVYFVYRIDTTVKANEVNDLCPFLFLIKKDDVSLVNIYQ